MSFFLFHTISKRNGRYVKPIDPQHLLHIFIDIIWKMFAQIVLLNNLLQDVLHPFTNLFKSNTPETRQNASYYYCLNQKPFVGVYC